MDDKELAFGIAQAFIWLQSEMESMRRVLDRSWSDPSNSWGLYVDRGKDQILNLEITHQRYAQLRSAFDAASGDGRLIRILHDELLQQEKA